MSLDARRRNDYSNLPERGFHFSWLPFCFHQLRIFPNSSRFCETDFSGSYAKFSPDTDLSKSIACCRANPPSSLSKISINVAIPSASPTDNWASAILNLPRNHRSRLWQLPEVLRMRADLFAFLKLRQSLQSIAPILSSTTNP